MHSVSEAKEIRPKERFVFPEAVYNHKHNIKFINPYENSSNTTTLFTTRSTSSLSLGQKLQRFKNELEKSRLPRRLLPRRINKDGDPIAVSPVSIQSPRSMACQGQRSKATAQENGLGQSMSPHLSTKSPKPAVHSSLFPSDSNLFRVPVTTQRLQTLLYERMNPKRTVESGNKPAGQQLTSANKSANYFKSSNHESPIKECVPVRKETNMEATDSREFYLCKWKLPKNPQLESKAEQQPRWADVLPDGKTPYHNDSYAAKQRISNPYTQVKSVGGKTCEANDTKASENAGTNFRSRESVLAFSRTSRLEPRLSPSGSAEALETIPSVKETDMRMSENNSTSTATNVSRALYSLNVEAPKKQSAHFQTSFMKRDIRKQGSFSKDNQPTNFQPSLCEDSSRTGFQVSLCEHSSRSVDELSESSDSLHDSEFFGRAKLRTTVEREPQSIFEPLHKLANLVVQDSKSQSSSPIRLIGNNRVNSDKQDERPKYPQNSSGILQRDFEYPPKISNKIIESEKRDEKSNYPPDSSELVQKDFEYLPKNMNHGQLASNYRQSYFCERGVGPHPDYFSEACHNAEGYSARFSSRHRQENRMQKYQDPDHRGKYRGLISSPRRKFTVITSKEDDADRGWREPSTSIKWYGDFDDREKERVLSSQRIDWNYPPARDRNHTKGDIEGYQNRQDLQRSGSSERSLFYGSNKETMEKTSAPGLNQRVEASDFDSIEPNNESSMDRPPFLLRNPCTNECCSPCSSNLSESDRSFTRDVGKPPSLGYERKRRLFIGEIEKDIDVKRARDFDTPYTTFPRNYSFETGSKTHDSAIAPPRLISSNNFRGSETTFRQERDYDSQRVESLTPRAGDMEFNGRTDAHESGLVKKSCVVVTYCYPRHPRHIKRGDPVDCYEGVLYHVYNRWFFAEDLKPKESPRNFEVRRTGSFEKFFDRIQPFERSPLHDSLKVSLRFLDYFRRWLQEIRSERNILLIS